MGMIELRLAHSRTGLADKSVYVNTSHIAAISSRPGGGGGNTTVNLSNGDNIFVVDSVEKILGKIEEAQQC